MPGISDDKPYMAFDYSSGKLIRSEELPGKTVCLIAHADLSLYPSEIVVEDSRLYGKWSDYKYYIVDLDGQDNISLINAQSESRSVSISSGKPLIGLTNGQTLKYISSQGNDVYIGNPPNIRIPLESEAQLDFWRISIHGTSLSETKYCKLHELSDLIEYKQEGSAELILADERLLGSHGFGRFSIRLRGPNRVDERFVFCFLSHFDAMFDKHIYLPVRSEEIPKAILSVKTAENVEFEPEAPAELISESPCYIQVDLTKEFIKGCLSYNPANGPSCRLPITIRLPKVQWRVRGLTKWSIRTKDISSDDWKAAKELLLDIRMPEDEDKEVSETPIDEDEVVSFGDEGNFAPDEDRYILCASCGAIDRHNLVGKMCGCDAANQYFVRKVKSGDGNVYRCPACGKQSPSGLVWRFLTGDDATASVLAESLYQQLPPRNRDNIDVQLEHELPHEDEWSTTPPLPSSSEMGASIQMGKRQLLIFSDSRQSAAFFAPYLNQEELAM